MGHIWNVVEHHQEGRMSLFKKSLFISLWVFVLAPAFAFDELTPNMDFLPDDSIEEIRDKIEAYGYEFTVDHNWVFDMSPEDKANFYSRHRPTSHYVEKDDIGPLAQHLGRDLPTSFDRSQCCCRRNLQFCDRSI